MAKVTFTNKKTVFYNELKAEVDQYFKERKLAKTGNWKLYIKTVTLVPAAITIYISLLVFNMPVALALFLCCLLGFILASIGFNVMHDACHGSYSSKKWVNNLFGLSINALGGNAFIWKFKHNIIHHTYTNVDGVDDDIAKSPLMRMCSSQEWKPAHRFQHIYVIPIYAISSFAWVFILDIQKYFKRKVVNTPLQKMDMKEHLIFWLSKILYVIFYILIPVYATSWQAWAIGYGVMQAVLGLTLAIIFQLAHVVEHTEFEAAGIEPTVIENEWAIHQVKTTADFAPRNKIISWFVGGLNYQIEHHLFPRISHIHYPAISKIVHNACLRAGLPYHQFPTMMKAVQSHFQTLRLLGKLAK